MQAIRNVGIAGMLGLLITNSLTWASRNTVASPLDPRFVAGLAESAVLGLLSFAFLTVGWLAVAVGIRRLP